MLFDLTRGAIREARMLVEADSVRRWLAYFLPNSVWTFGLRLCLARMREMP